MAKTIPGLQKGQKKQDCISIQGTRNVLDYFGIHGQKTGPTLLVNAGVHGNEIVGVQIIRRLYETVRPERLSGNLLLVPVVNKSAFEKDARTSPGDGQDMNRVFPGKPIGSLTEKVAFAFFNELASAANAIIDLHSMMSPDAMVPHVRIRVDEQTPEYKHLIRATGLEYFWEGTGINGMLQVEAASVGIPCATIEIGVSSRFTDRQVRLGLGAVLNVMKSMKMIRGSVRIPEKVMTIQNDISWLPSPMNGIFRSISQLGKKVRKDTAVGEVLNPESLKTLTVKSPYAGTVVGLRLNSVAWEGQPLALVMPD